MYNPTGEPFHTSSIIPNNRYNIQFHAYLYWAMMVIFDVGGGGRSLPP